MNLYYVRKQNYWNMVCVFLLILLIPLFVCASERENYEFDVLVDLDPTARFRIYDTDHDGQNELISYFYIHDEMRILEHGEGNQYTSVFSDENYPYLVGDVDNDGKSDILITFMDERLKWTLLESLSSDTHPTELVGDMDEFSVSENWFYQAVLHPQYRSRFADLDKDGRGEILTNYVNPPHAGVMIFEQTSDNVFRFKNALRNPCSNFEGFHWSVGDTDKDGLNEIIIVSTHAETNCSFSVYECTGDDVYSFVSFQYLDLDDVSEFNVVDLNGNGIPELCFGGVDESYKLHYQIMEWNGGEYATKGMISDLYDSYYYASTTGDIDGDGKDELVIYTNKVEIYKWNVTDSYYRIAQIPVDHLNLTNVAEVYCSDVNRNGYAEIICPSNSTHPEPYRTYIFEIDPETAPGTPVPTPTQTSTPDFNSPRDLSFKAQTLGTHYEEHQYFRLFSESINPGPPINVVQMIALEYENNFWLWPSWCKYPCEDFVEKRLDTGIHYEKLLEFYWPATIKGEMTVWSLMLDSETSDLLSLNDWKFYFTDEDWTVE